MGPTNPAKTRSKRYAEKYIKKFETVKKNGKQKRFPDFIITGVQKCGTTGLMHYLQGNPYLKAVPGEAHYFDSAINYAKGLVRDSNYSASSDFWIFHSPQRRPQIGFYPQIGGPQIGETTVKNFERNEKFTMIYFFEPVRSIVVHGKNARSSSLSQSL